MKVYLNSDLLVYNFRKTRAQKAPRPRVRQVLAKKKNGDVRLQGFPTFISTNDYKIAE